MKQLRIQRATHYGLIMDSLWTHYGIIGSGTRWTHYGLIMDSLWTRHEPNKDPKSNPLWTHYGLIVDS